MECNVISYSIVRTGAVFVAFVVFLMIRQNRRLTSQCNFQELPSFEVGTRHLYLESKRLTASQAIDSVQGCFTTNSGSGSMVCEVVEGPSVYPQDLGPPYSQSPGRIPKMDPPEGSIIYTIGVLESRIGSSRLCYML